MTGKKARWREGIVVSGFAGGPDRPATEDLALRYLRKASAEKDPAKRERYRKSAELVGVLGRANESMVDLSTYKPGRPKGGRLGALDSPMHEFMEKMAAEADEIRPYSLARLATEAADIPESEREAAIRRLVRWWNRRDRQK